jgi:hypothetical protein
MSETLGALVDKLCTLNIKTYMAQDWLYRMVQMTPEEFAQQPHPELQEEMKKLTSLNLERSRAMTEIDECFAAGIFSGEVKIDERIKLTGGN